MQWINQNLIENSFFFLLNYIFSFNFSLDMVFLLSLNSFTLCRRDAAAPSNLGYISHLCISIYTYLSVYMHHVYSGDCGGCKEGIQTFGTDDKKGLQASQCWPWELNQVLQQAQRVLLSTGSFTPAVPDDSSLGISQSLWLPCRSLVLLSCALLPRLMLTELLFGHYQRPVLLF